MNLLLTRSKEEAYFFVCWPFLFPSFLWLNWLLLINCFIPLFSQGSAELDFLATIIPDQQCGCSLYSWPLITD
ncbi:hypothetical protein ERO13_A13G047125v2 [Gossypium hirsutum]|nr:hypothetical protein ERO13_A13G047125v2 [Gossypium hirsutum]